MPVDFREEALRGDESLSRGGNSNGIPTIRLPKSWGGDSGCGGHARYKARSNECDLGPRRVSTRLLARGLRADRPCDHRGLRCLHIPAAEGPLYLARRVDRFHQSVRNQPVQTAKLYQAIIDQSCDPLANSADASHREARRLETIYRALEDVVAATGQFRVVQVKLIPLYGHDPEIFAYYLAIWRYLKEVRDRMGRSETLYFHSERPDSTDAFYLLIDSFRYQIMLRPFVRRPPGLARPSEAVLADLRRRGDGVYAEYFVGAVKEPTMASISTAAAKTTAAVASA